MQQAELKTNALLVKIHATHHIFIYSFCFFGNSKGYGTKLQCPEEVTVGARVAPRQVEGESVYDNVPRVFTLLLMGVVKASSTHGTTQTNKFFSSVGLCTNLSKR